MHFCSWGSWAWVKLINKQARKPVLFYKFHCFLKIFICLSRKTTDDVCSNCYSRHSAKKVERNTELRTCKCLAPLKPNVHTLINLQLYLQKLRPKMIFGKKITRFKYHCLIMKNAFGTQPRAHRTEERYCSKYWIRIVTEE